MNHITKDFAAGDGRHCRCHSWEIREGGYRRIALFVGNGIWPVAKETRLIGFLLDRGFRVLAPEIAFGSSSVPRFKLDDFRQAVAALSVQVPSKLESALPLYLLASSASAGALLPVVSSLPGLASIALIAPIVDFPPPGLHRRLLFWRSAELAIVPDALSGMPELLKDLVPERPSLNFRARDLKKAAADLASRLDMSLGVPFAAFSGDDDPLITKEGRLALERAGAKLYSYPRVRHEPGHDRYADNFYADLGSFLDSVEAGNKA
jgi:alpha-beta hydrolase superfamily lysophospholipase